MWTGLPLVGLLLDNEDYSQDKFGVKLLREKITALKKIKVKVSKMNYYLPRYDLPLVLGYSGPGLSFCNRDWTINSLYGSQRN